MSKTKIEELEQRVADLEEKIADLEEKISDLEKKDGIYDNIIDCFYAQDT